jgi:type I restriction enzyme S subunit
MSWVTKKLGEATTVLSGTTPKSGVPKFWGSNNVWITPTDLGKLNGDVVADSVRKISDDGVCSCNLPVIPKGAIVMSSRAPIGHLAVAGCDLYTNQGCKSFVCSRGLDPEFLFYTLKYKMPEIRALGSGATFTEVSKTILENFEISYPVEIEDQRRMASRLKAQLAEVEKARKAAEVQLADAKLLQSRMLDSIFSALDSAPKKRIGDEAETTSGTTPARGQKNFWEPTEIPWVKTGEIAFVPITRTEEFVSKKALEECSLRLLPKKTVLVAMYGQGKTRGQSAILEVEATTNQACFAVLPNATWEPEFLYLWLKKSYQDLRSLSENRGGNQANLNGALLKAVEVPAPDKAIQKAVTAKVNAALKETEAIIAACRSTLASLDELPQKILAAAFEGGEG